MHPLHGNHLRLAVRGLAVHLIQRVGQLQRVRDRQPDDAGAEATVLAQENAEDADRPDKDGAVELQPEAQPAGGGVAEVVGLALRLEEPDTVPERLVLLPHGADGGHAAVGLGEVADDGAPGRGVEAAQVAGGGQVSAGQARVQEEHGDDEEGEVPAHEHAHHHDGGRPPRPQQVCGHGNREVVVEDVRVLRQPVQDLPHWG
mmetsp:Transcript_37377/g.99027  ORF Transcript_37377/g.99027 Transcript_37377/m.99027 type:complete len:202 (-) Transcript_37377:1120-1725(-)